MTIHSLKILIPALLSVASMAQADDPPAVVNGVRGVKQATVQSIEKAAPPTTAPVAVDNPQTVDKVDNVDAVKGVTTSCQNPPPPPPATAAHAAQGVNKVEGVKTAAPNAVQPVAPPPAGAIGSIRAVQGVQGIIAPKQLNLEAALLIKEDAKGTPAASSKAKAAAAALLQGPTGTAPSTTAPTEDGRADFLEFEKLTAPGS